MKASKLNLDLSKVEAESSSMFSKVPAGEYVVSLAHSQFRDGKKANAAGLQVGYMIEEGPQKGKMVSDYINIMNDNQQAVDIGLRRLRKILELQGRNNFKLVTDLDLINRNTFMVSVAIEPNSYTKNDGTVVDSEQSVVKKLYEVETNAKATASAASKGVSKPAAKATPVVEEDAHVEEGTDERPPWMV